MTRQASLIVSYVFHPLMMPTFTFGLLYFFMPQVIKPLSLITLPFLFFTTFLVPLASVYMLKILGSIRSLSMVSKEERIIPFFFVTIFYAMTAYMFIYKIQVNQTVGVIFVSTCLLLLVLSIITIWHKISIHTAGICCVLGYLMALAFFWPEISMTNIVITILILSGAVMSVRMHLNAHSPEEVASGAFVGFGMGFGALYLFS